MEVKKNSVGHKIPDTVAPSKQGRSVFAGLVACPLRLLCPPPLAVLSPWQPSRQVMQQLWMCTVLFAEVQWHALYHSEGFHLVYFSVPL